MHDLATLAEADRVLEKSNTTNGKPPKESLPTKIHNYRPDIDGLRCIAVVSVVLNHAFPEIFPGGFAGVDIFYVISGYLITGILADQIGKNNFSLVDFYARRTRRILPALVVLLAVTTLAAAMILAPHNLSTYGKSMVATALFVSNIHFMMATDYFAPAAALTPLLHTWSLAVEEQFYIFFPLILYGAAKLNRPKLAIIALLIPSFLLSVLLVRAHPVETFYLFPTRAWELLIGSVLALGMVAKARTRLAAEILSVVGALLLSFSFATLNKASLFPGETALAPCLGAALLIHAGIGHAGALVGSILTLRPVVFIGKISYSLYLWHWPILSLLHYRLGELTPPVTIAALLASVVLATLSWRFVEQRFHNTPGQVVHVPKAHVGKSKVVIAGLAALGVVAAIGVSLYALKSQLLVRKVYPVDIAALNAVTKQASSPLRCQTPQGALELPECRVGDPRKPATIALWGDSYVDALKSGLAERLENHSAYAFILHSCPSIIGVQRIDERPEFRNFGPKCTATNNETLRLLSSHPEINTVVLFNNFTRVFDVPGEPPRLVPDGFDVQQGHDRMERITDQVIRTAQTLNAMGKRVVIVGAYYATENHGAQKLLQRRMTTRDIRAEMEETLYDRYSKSMNDRLRAASGDDIRFVDPKPMFCPQGAARCDFAPDGVALLVDGYHITPEGARRMMNMLAPTLSEENF